jgi:hypothetical protein
MANSYIFKTVTLIGTTGGAITLEGVGFLTTPPTTASLLLGSTVIATETPVTKSDTLAEATFSFAERPPGEGYHIQWTIGSDRPRNLAAIVKNELYPSINDADLYQRAGALNPAAKIKISDILSWESYRNEAWIMISNRLFSLGRRPWLILDASSLRESHIQLTLGLIFQDLGTSRGNESFAQRAALYFDGYEREFTRVRITYEDQQKKAKPGYFWMTGRGV